LLPLRRLLCLRLVMSTHCVRRELLRGVVRFARGGSGTHATGRAAPSTLTGRATGLLLLLLLLQVVGLLLVNGGVRRRELLWWLEGRR
jgi:hypothetical protein